jgi:hypothetical protein
MGGDGSLRRCGAKATFRMARVRSRKLPLRTILPLSICSAPIIAASPPSDTVAAAPEELAPVGAGRQPWRKRQD